jgi:hypothetical protein
MLGLTPTILGLMDTINRTYGMVDNIPVEQTVNFALGLDDTPLTGQRIAKAYMYGSDGRDNRSAARGLVYSPLPLIARPLNNPLTPAERERYFLRKEVTIDGVNYEVYYGGRLPEPSAMSSLRYTSYNAPTSVHSTTPLLLLPHYHDWTNAIGGNSIIRLASTITLEHRDVDVQSLLAACALLSITVTDIREIGIVAGIEYEVSAGITELSNAICINHSALDGPLMVPGVEINIGVLTGVML